MEQWQALQRNPDPEELEIYMAAYREASKRLLAVLNRGLIFIISAENSHIAAWQVAFAVGADVVGEETMSDVAAKFALKRACFSKGAQAFRRFADLPPSRHMKDAASTGAYQDARNDQLITVP